jgi:tRNA/rRNA methyltransferase
MTNDVPPPLQFTVILVRPKYPRNIGMVSRAMCNYGQEKLIIIDAQCELDVHARKGAAQGQGPLRSCILYDTWDDYAYNEPESTRIAFSRRSGKRRPSQPFNEVLQWPVLTDGRPVSLIFGAEDHGLSREDLLWAHRTATLDIPGPLMSMNLSHAVMLALSQLPRNTGGDNSKDTATQNTAIKTPDDILRTWLETLEFDLSTKNWNAFYAMRQMIMKASPTEHELELFTAIIEQTVRAIEPGYSRKNFKPKTDKPDDDYSAS